VATILVIDDDFNTLRLLGYALERSGFQVQLAGDGEEGLAKAFQQPPDLIVLDVMMPGLNGYEVCRRLRADSRTAEVPTIILTARSQRVDQQAALEAGADLHMSKPVTPSDLLKGIGELLSRPPSAPPAAGWILSLFSLRGGVGVTSVAVNLSVALAQQHRVRVFLADLSLAAGHAAFMLNLRPKQTVAHLLAGQVDSETIQSHLIPHASGVRVLAAPPVPPPPGAISADAIEGLLTALKLQAGYIVVDTASALDDVTMSVLGASDTILVVFSPDILSVQTTIVTCQTLQGRGIDPGKLQLVLNQTMPKPVLSLERIKDALQQPIKIRLPYDEGQSLAIVKGQPLLISDPTLPLAVVIKDLASAVSVRK